MKGYHLIWINLLFLVKPNAATFFHVPSYVQMSSDGQKDFGFTMDYNPTSNNLIVGAPFSGLDGKIYKCPLSNVLTSKNIACSEIFVNVSELAPESTRGLFSDQHFALGASIAVTPDYIFTCAPLTTFDVVTKGTNKLFGTYGTCFMVQDTTPTNVTRFLGMLERFQNKDFSITKNPSDFYGGVGWTTLFDKKNEIILIGNPMSQKGFGFMDQQSPERVMKMNSKLRGYTYKGRALASGVFFSNNETLYAVSMDVMDQKFPGVAFFNYKEDNKLQLLKYKDYDLFIDVTSDYRSIGSMFGSTLHGADLNSDGYTELIVGAPARAYSDSAYENGAIYVYLGGEDIRKKSTLCIYNTIDASRFGSAIATADLDGDHFLEIFVSAPYEKKGVIYVFSGHSIKKYLNKKDTSLISVHELANTQKIENQNLETLGFSLKALTVPSLSENVYDLLAAGSPVSGKVVLYRSVPFITVAVFIEGPETVREKDDHFTVNIKVNITYPPTPISGKLLVTVNVDGVEASIDNIGENRNEFEIMLSERKAEYVRSVVVTLGNDDPGLYKCTAKVESDVEKIKQNDFDSTLVTVHPKSNLTADFKVVRQCKGEDCVPKLTMRFEWSGRNDTHYGLGSTSSETMTVIVRNDGTMTYESCARIRVTGAQIASLECDEDSDNWYKCPLINIDRHTERYIPVQLAMGHHTNRDIGFTIEGLLYNKCSSVANGPPQSTKITYVLNTDGVYLSGDFYNRMITQREIENVETGSNIEINALFTAVNNGTISWNSIPFEISLKKEPFIRNFSLVADTNECKKSDIKNSTLLVYNCIVDLTPGYHIKISTTVTIEKEKVLENLKDGRLRMTSNFTIRLEPTTEEISQLFTTQILYKVDVGFGQNKTLIIAVAVVLAAFGMAIMSFILYKVGFFKRKEKNKLNMLKDEIRKQSVRRPAVSPCEYNINCNDPQHHHKAKEMRGEEANSTD